mgnify:CR=1 FL=1
MNTDQNGREVYAEVLIYRGQGNLPQPGDKHYEAIKILLGEEDLSTLPPDAWNRNRCQFFVDGEFIRETGFAASEFFQVSRALKDRGVKEIEATYGLRSYKGGERLITIPSGDSERSGIEKGLSVFLREVGINLKYKN